MKTLEKSVIAVVSSLSLLGCSTASEGSTSTADAKYSVGVIQLVQHAALDAATEGFKDALEEALGNDVRVDVQVAAGDSTTCVTIANSYVSEGVDLIMANATPALQAVASSTKDIPVLGTSVTEYGVALSLDDFNGTVGGNISGTSDLAPLDQQAALFEEILPDAERIGILYCSAEANSVYQAEEVRRYLEKEGKKVKIYTFTDTNDVSSVTQSAVSENDALYIPTDNTAASAAEAINNIAEPAGIPIIAGEEGICRSCGIVTLSIDYYELGRLTGEMAVKVLTGEEKISEMPIEYYGNVIKKYSKERAGKLGIKIPSDFTAIEE